MFVEIWTCLNNKNILVSVLSSKIIMKLEISRHIFEKYSNIKFHENSSVSVTLFHVDRRTDDQTNMTKPYSLLAIFEMAPKNIHDFQIYGRKYLYIFKLPSLSRISLRWKGTSYTVAVHPICLCNWIINWNHVTVVGWLWWSDESLW